MVMKSFRLFFGLLLVFSVLLSLNFVVADFVDCWANSGTSESICEAVDGGGVCQWKTSAEDPWCDYEDTGCCMDIGCWDYDGTNSTVCETNDGTLNCTWDPYFQMYYPNGTLGELGGCMGDWDNMDWGGMTDGCWNYDGDKAACGMNSCNWKPNGANENSWCWINSLSDAQMENPSATLTDIGCCEQTGCWSYDENETICGEVFNGMCFYESSSYGGGWCMAKMCSDADGNETQCNTLKNDLYMPCNWINDSGQEECDDAYWDGGFGAFDDVDSCFAQGGWYNSTGACVMPSDDFMFSGGAHCWFADNQPLVCGNVTGCAYCVEGDVLNGVENETDNICYNKQVGWCEGHVSGDLTYANADNSADLACGDIQLKSACKYGPLPYCIWGTTNTTVVGDYCTVGTTSDKAAEPPVPFCEHPDSKNNYTMCMQLITEFMMPCTWDNTSTIVKNCTFNPSAVFGSGGETDLGVISSATSCTSAGGTWQTENYVEDGILKQDSWCEMTGFFDVDDGGGEGNKGNCDTSCWACEFKYDGSDWENVTVAEAACTGSALGYCSWEASSDSFSGHGWCDYPTEMESGGAKDCNLECEGCNFMNNPEVDCELSVAECKWVNDSTDTGAGSCVDVSKKTCDNDCFSCYSSDSCYDSESDVSCEWDNDFALCKPQSYSGEICFNGFDDDGDGMIDCGDPDCGFDNFCGGSAFGGDCFAQMSEGECNTTFAFELGGEDLNCTWVVNDWETEGHCDMPGSNCWQYDSDLAACGAISGCTNDSSSMMMGGSSMCDINMTLMDSSNCWNNPNESVCSGDCQWVNDSWCESNPDDDWCNSTGGWCDFKPFATCMSLNSTSCGDNSNCTWKEDSYSMIDGDAGGWCDVACFNPNWEAAECENATLGGLCEYRNMSETCQPEMFMMMGMGSGGQTGCWQYDGNETGCVLNSVTCQYKNDTYANNNVSVDEPDGWCMDKAEFDHFGEMKGDIIELAMDSGNFGAELGPPGAELGVSGEVDMMGMGMRVTDEGFNFGVGVYNISKAVMCNGYNVGAGMDSSGNVSEGTMGAGNATTKFYWYLDTDGDETGNCMAYGEEGHEGYEFMISYVSSNETGNIVETKKLMKCNEESWVSTNVLITTSKQMGCGEIGGVMVAIEKQGLESFSEYSKTSNMRIFLASSNGSDSRTNPSDDIGPGYYTPGMIDFGFVDCSNPNTKDPKCKNMQKFGFNVFEECMNGVDDDENGLTDCADPMCLFTPKCAELLGNDAFAFASDSEDKTAPTVMFSKVDVLSDAAFMKVDTNEPSSLNVSFYHNDSTCTVLNPNETLNDVGSETYQTYANFKPFHSIDLTSDSLGYPLTNGTSYYYKITVCDPSDNCAVSACSNFTTKSSIVAKQFILKLDLPDGYTVDIPALNKTGYNFTETFGEVAYDVGIKTNSSVTKNMNFTVHSNCGDGMSIGFYGVNIFGPMKIDMTNAFVCDEDTNMMGMNSSLKKWNTLIDEMHLGGASDYIQIEMPVTYSDTNTFNFVDDSGLNPEDVDDYVNCEAGSGAGTTACQVPVSLGF